MLFWWKEFIVIYLFIACCIQLILLASIGNSRCFEGEIAKQSTWSWLKVIFIDWYQNPTVFSVCFSCKLESVESECHSKEAAAVGARLPVAFCCQPLPWNSLNHGALSHAHCMLQVAAVARSGGCYGGPKRGVHMVAPLWPKLLSGPKYSLQKAAQEQLLWEVRRGALLLWPLAGPAHTTGPSAVAAGLGHQLHASFCKSQGDRPSFFLNKLCTALRWLWAYAQASVQFSTLSHPNKCLSISGERVQPFWGPREVVKKTLGVMPLCRGAYLVHRA